MTIITFLHGQYMDPQAQDIVSAPAFSFSSQTGLSLGFSDVPSKKNSPETQRFIDLTDTFIFPLLCDAQINSTPKQGLINGVMDFFSADTYPFQYLWDTKNQIMTDFLHSSAYLYTTGWTSIPNLACKKAIFQYLAAQGKIYHTYPYDASLAQGDVNQGDVSFHQGLLGIHPEAEHIALAQDLILVETTHCHYHATCLSTKASLDLIRQAKQKGLPVSCDTALPYALENEISIYPYQTSQKLFPPLRCEEDRQAVVQAIKDHTVDFIISGHRPQPQSKKQTLFTQAAFGGNTLDFFIPLLFSLHCNEQIPLMEILRKTTLVPRKRFQIPHCNPFETGQEANFVVFNPRCPFKLTADKLTPPFSSSPFLNKFLEGKIVQIYYKGQPYSC